MADTVEQVYVWSGDDWVPVVRDETVSNTSELTNDGEDGVNPFITAADIPAVPDKKLPISSADGTVTLGSPSANTFTISTGGTEQVRITDAAATFSGDIQTSRIVGPAPDTDASIELGANATINSSDQVSLRINSTTDSCYLGLKNNSEPAGYFGFMGENIVISAGSVGAIQMTITPDEAVKVPTQLQTGKITSLVGAANDASIELGAELLTSNHTPTQPNSIATKQTVDDKIWVGTTAEYNALGTKNPTTLYCLTD